MPTLSQSQIDVFDQELNYTMDDVHLKENENPLFEDKLKQIEEAVKDHINSSTPPYSEIQTLLYKLGLWYAWHKRDSTNAIQYLTLCKHENNSDYRYIYVCSLLGYSCSIKYPNQTIMLFESVLLICKHLAKKETFESFSQVNKLFLDVRKMIVDTYARLIKFSKTENLDTANILQLLADINLCLSNYKIAADHYITALDIKIKFVGDKPSLVDLTKKLITNLLISCNHYFDFDWHEYTKNDNNQLDKHNEAEKVLKLMLERRDALDNEGSQQLALLALNVAIFYNHIYSKPLTALSYQVIAKDFFIKTPLINTHVLEYTLLLSHMAYSLVQIVVEGKPKLTNFKENVVWEMAQNSCIFNDNLLHEKKLEGFNINDIFYLATYTIDLSKKYLLSSSNKEGIKISLFIYCVDALIKYENHQLDLAVNSYHEVLHLYEKYQLNENSNQYPRIKKRYIEMLVEQKHPLQDPAVIYEDLHKYWKSQKDVKSNPFAIQFFNSYEKFKLTQTQPTKETVTEDTIPVSVTKFSLISTSPRIVKNKTSTPSSEDEEIIVSNFTHN